MLISREGQEKIKFSSLPLLYVPASLPVHLSRCAKTIKMTFHANEKIVAEHT